MEARLPPPAFDTLRAAALAVLVHLLFFAFLAFGVRWQNEEPEPVVATLWADLPMAPRPAAPVASTPRPEPVVRPQAAPEPPTAISRPDIALKTRPETRKPAPPVEKPRPVEKPVATRVPAPQPEVDPVQRQLELIQQQQAAAEAARLAAAQQSVIGEYKARIKRKIRGNLNRQPCGQGNPELEFDLVLLPTGQLRGNPVLTRSSGIPACDRAVEYAIVQADPLPVPSQPELFSAFRNLHLIVRPNDPND